MNKYFLVCFVMVAATGANAQSRAKHDAGSTPRYEIKETSLVDGGFMEPLVINDTGDMAGLFAANLESNSVPFFKLGKGPAFGIPVAGSSAGSRIWDINRDGVVVGAYSTEIGGKLIGYVASKRSGVRLLDFRARGINDVGSIIGNKTLEDKSNRAILLRGEFEKILSPLSGHTDALVLDENERGEIVGYSADKGSTQIQPGDANMYPTLWDDNGAPIALPIPAGFTDARAVAINNKGTVVLMCWGKDHTSTGLFLVNRDGTNLRRIPDVSETLRLSDRQASVVSHLNDRNELVGYTTTGDNSDLRGWLFKDGQLYDLAQLVPVDSPVKPIYASWINNKGQIVGLAMKGQKEVGFIMTPRA